MNDTNTPGRVLRGLGQLAEFEPPPDAWSAIEARLAAPPAGHRGRLAGLAVVGFAAVAIAIRLMAPASVTAPQSRAGAGPAATAAAAAADALDARSSRLEELLAALPPSRSGRASTGLTTTLLEDRIALVDERLSEPAALDLPAETTEALKRQRVVLLDSLVRVRYASAVIVSL